MALADPADRALYDRLSAQVMGLYDEPRGGFVGKDGKPNEAAIELCLARGAEGDSVAMARALHTLRWMHVLLDTVGGGFFEGTKDVDHATAAFNKRTDSNMRRLELLARVANRKGETFAKDARGVVDYAERLLSDHVGGFYSGQGGTRELEPGTNGIALRGWWRWAVHSEDPRQKDFAVRSHERLWKDCRDAELGMVRRDTWGKVRQPSLLPDQAEMGRAYLYGWQAAGRDTDLTRARVLAQHLRDHFVDREKGGFASDYVAQTAEVSRRGSGAFEANAVAARFFAELGVATGDTAWTNTARRAWVAFDKQFEKPRLESAEWALAIRATWAGIDVTQGDWAAKRFLIGGRAPVKRYGGGGRRR
jgi:uncharacterized protein YyaL (SSP411 family)